jgi:hypothetical protein
MGLEPRAAYAAVRRLRGRLKDFMFVRRDEVVIGDKGVIRDEGPVSAPPIALAPMDVAAFVDTFAQGPLHEPVPVTNWREFQMLFGGFHPTSEASYGVYLFFENGGEFAWVVRVADPAESGLALVGAGGERQASPGAMADSLLGSEGRGTGIHALRGLQRKPPGLLLIPRAAELGVEGARVYSEARRLCEALGMLLLVDPPLLADSPAEVRAWVMANPDLASPNVGLYYPRILFPDALQHGRNRSFGASGAVAGLLSWLDQERGIWRAPAGLHAALDAVMVGRDLGQEELPALTEMGINAIRDFPGHGTVLWGARTLLPPAATGSGAIAEQKYIPVRRFMMAVERSLRKDLQWAVFEPNDEGLWARVARAVEVFLDGLWRQGAFAGAKPEDAYFVRCDRTTMTASDIEAGTVVLQVGMAPVKATEFHLVSIALPRAAEG